MTDLDDALNSSTPLYNPFEIFAEWLELPPGYSAVAGTIDTLRDLGSQLGPGGYTVTQSFDDGLPDSVTMTTSNDASGSLTAELVGRQANIADASGFRASPGTTGGTGSGTSITVTLPADTFFGDYSIVAISANNQTDVTEMNSEEGDPLGWRMLGSQIDSTAKTWVFGRAFYTGAPAPDFRIATSAAWSWVTATVSCAQTAAGTMVPVTPEVTTSIAETVTGTAHTSPIAELPTRGYVVAVFAGSVTNAPFTVTGDAIEINEASSTMDVMIARSPLRNSPGSYTISANSATSTGIGMYFTIPMVIRDRPAMDARQYFSPFNAKSPISAFERDTAPVTASVNVVTPNGPVSTRIFKGQMAGTPLSGRVANLSAVSQTRIELDKAIQLPGIIARREGCTTDWIASFVAAHGGQYFGAAPSIYTKFWAPCHGSMHAFMDGKLGYYTGYEWRANSVPKGYYSNRYPESVPGPYLSGIYAQQKDDVVKEVRFSPDRVPSNEVPGMGTGAGYDYLSQQNNRGRITFWLRGDSAVANPAALADSPAENRLFTFLMYNDNQPGVGAYIRLLVKENRQTEILLGNQTVVLGGSDTYFPADGEWHWFAFSWDYAAGTAQNWIDGNYWETTTFTTSETLPVTDAAHRAAGRFMYHGFAAHLPISELQQEAGPTMYTEGFWRFQPLATPDAPSKNATISPTHQFVEALAEPVPLQGWTLLQEIAQATASMLRVNESDNLELLSLGYFGQDEQMTVDTMNFADTDVNAGELAVVTDPSKTRNVVTIEFPETRVDSNRTAVLALTQSLQVPPGVTTITFALDLPTVEIHGAASPYAGSVWTLTKLTTAQASGSSALPFENFMSVNRYEDGGGTTFTASTFSARIIDWDTSTVTIRFTNASGAALYLSNSGQQIPFLQVLGYPVRRATAYSTSSDTNSRFSRRERAMTTMSNWIQRRPEAAELGGLLMTVLARPRPEVNVQVMGDPRRVPGKLVRLADADGTAADGTWRVLSVKSSGGGPRFTQDLQLVQVMPPGIWDETNWDEGVWGE